MKVCVITRHAPANYGSLLQSIAMQKVIQKLGHECEIIDYILTEETGMKVAATQLKTKKEWNGSLIKKLVYLILRQPENLIMYSKFENMREKFLRMTKRYSSKNELIGNLPQTDIFMTGSDQVWGPTASGKYDDVYFLSFAPDTTKKVSYAASFGKSKFTEETLCEYEKLLTRYDKITVRENSAIDILNNMNIECCGQVLDPTLLLDSKEWGKYIKEDVQGKYVLVYQIHNNSKLDSYAKAFAKNLGLPLIRVSPLLHQIIRGGKFVYCPDIGKFLSLIKNATYMITDSFHGTAFAINFNTQFIEILPNTGTGNRNQSILELTGLKNRILTDYNDFSIEDNNIDYDKINVVINEQRKYSVDILKHLLGK